MVPETVPASSEIAGENTAAVLFAGIVKSAVLDPFENRTIGSSPAVTLLDVNVRLSVPVIAVDCGADIDIPTTTC